MEGTMAEIRGFAGNFAPRNWMYCDGRLLAISTYSALFSLLGTTYGGDGRTTFALPDLRGRVPVGTGTGPGLPAMNLGEVGGTETNTLTINQLPAHSHSVAANNGTSGRNLAVTPGSNFIAQNGDGSGNFANTTDTQMNPKMISMTGNSMPVNNMQPFLGMNYIICYQGIFPSRN